MGWTEKGALAIYYRKEITNSQKLPSDPTPTYPSMHAYTYTHIYTK